MPKLQGVLRPKTAPKKVWLSIPVFWGEHVAFQLTEACCMIAWTVFETWIHWIFCHRLTCFFVNAIVHWQHTQSFLVVWGLYSGFIMSHSICAHMVIRSIIEITWQWLVQKCFLNVWLHKALAKNQDFSTPWQRAVLQLYSNEFNTWCASNPHTPTYKIHVVWVHGCCFEGERWQRMGLWDYCWGKRSPAAIWYVLSVVCKINGLHFCPSVGSCACWCLQVQGNCCPQTYRYTYASSECFEKYSAIVVSDYH